MSDLGNKAVMAENINRLMAEKGVCRADVCKALGFKYSTFSDWCAGNVYPRIDKIELMAEYFGVRKSELVERRPGPEDELEELLDTLRSRDDMRMLFKLAKDATPEDVRQAVKIIEALRGE